MKFGDPICQNVSNSCYCYVLSYTPHRLPEYRDLIYLNWFYTDTLKANVHTARYTCFSNQRFDPIGVPRLIVSIPQQTLFFPKFSVTFDEDFNDMDIKSYEVR